MNKTFLALMMCAGLATMVSGCYAEEVYTEAPPVAAANGCVAYTDDWGTREVCAPYYYLNGEVVYWDAHFGCWIGPHGYWLGGGWHPGFVGGYHGYYGSHVYHGWHGGSFHGGYHGRGHR